MPVGEYHILGSGRRYGLIHVKAVVVGVGFHRCVSGRYRVAFCIVVDRLHVSPRLVNRSPCVIGLPHTVVGEEQIVSIHCRSGNIERNIRNGQVTLEDLFLIAVGVQWDLVSLNITVRLIVSTIHKANLGRIGGNRCGIDFVLVLTNVGFGQFNRFLPCIVHIELGVDFVSLVGNPDRVPLVRFVITEVECALLRCDCGGNVCHRE